MKEFLLSIGFWEQSKNVFTDMEDWEVIIRGNKADVYTVSCVNGDTDWFGTADTVEQLEALLHYI